ncbi:nucleotidyltransferase domain-containing protein [Nocardioides seonyuensis]|uniref:nucleotidyltransferase domain-containing protein n=1 Tax=Nocardioides seonyuensis TaxID=2518371 RepID=UPI001423FA43|nr:nucleotidyltransferase family protein [Nocardioides seonyuensis]
MIADLYVEDGRGVVMVGESVLVLTEVATAIVEAVPDASTLTVAEVAASVVEVFGEPDAPHTAEGLTLQHVHDLVAHGVLEIVEGSRDGTASLLDQRTRRDAVEAVRSALRHVLSGGTDRWSLPPSVESDAFVKAAHQHHVVAFLALHLDRLTLPPRARSVLLADAAHLQAGARILATDLARALEVLDAAGVRALAFKGVALAVQAHGDLTARGAGDLDLLVAPADLERAHAALTRAGWSPAPEYPVPGPSWAWRHFVRTHNELTLESATSSIDLHWHLAPTRSTFPPFDDLWLRRDLVEVAGRAVPTLSPYDALAHSAGHAARDRWRWLRSLVDVHLLASRSDVWSEANRPLRSDQLLTLGVAVRMLGDLPGAPAVVVRAVSESSDVWKQALADQLSTEVDHRALATPGQQFTRNLRTLARTRGTPTEAARLLSRSALPPWLTSQETSPHALVAAPKVLARRLAELEQKARARLR